MRRGTRRDDLGSIGLIGSAGKWARFRRRLTEDGGHDGKTIARIKTPVGIPGIVGKAPATIALSIAADLLQALEHQRNADAPPGTDAARQDRARGGTPVS